jgi:hypothetical protein
MANDNIIDEAFTEPSMKQSELYYANRLDNHAAKVHELLTDSAILRYYHIKPLNLLGSVLAD